MLRIITKSLISNGCAGSWRSCRQFAAVAATNRQEKWDIFAGVLVERLPVIAKELNKLETEFQQLLDQTEYENSCLSDIEIRHIRDVKTAEKVKKDAGNLDVAAVTVQTAQDDVDAWKKELAKFQFAPRTTAADTSNDITSVNRKLDDTLVLLTAQHIGNRKLFVLPQGKRSDGETLRQTAERVLLATCGTSLNVHIWGNAPCAFYKYRYPNGHADVEAIGAKIFFFRAIYSSGGVDQKLSEFAWLNKDEVVDKLQQHRKYVRCLKPLFL